MFSEEPDRRKEEERMRAEKRLPPGQSLTLKFPVLHYGPVPPFSPPTWSFKVWGEVAEEKSWSWDEFNQFPRSKIQMDIHCVTRWSRFDTEWEGVSVRDLLERGFFKINPQAKYVMQHAEYGFTVNLPLEVVLAENFIMATHHNGELLTPDHGYPLRGVVGYMPGREELPTPYLWKGAKWLRSLEFMMHDRMGFWEQAGYHNNADAWKEERLRT